MQIFWQTFCFISGVLLGEMKDLQALYNLSFEIKFFGTLSSPLRLPNVKKHCLRDLETILDIKKPNLLLTHLGDVIAELFNPNRYSPKVRPVLSSSDVVNVTFGLVILHVDELVGRLSSMRTRIANVTFGFVYFVC